VKHENFLSGILDKGLSLESKNKLNKLNKLRIQNLNNEKFARLNDAMSEDKLIRFIFEYASKNQTLKIDGIPKDYISTNEIIEMLHISRRTLAVWRASGILPYIKYRNTVYYSTREIEKLLRESYTGNK
jgi:hypothetical protein